MSTPFTARTPARPAAAPGRWGWVVAALFACAVLALLHADGVPAASLARYGVYVVWGLFLPGFVVRRLLWPPARTWFGEAVLAITTGLAVELVAWAAFVGVGAGGALRLWPLVTLVSLAFPSCRTRLRARPSESFSTVDMIMTVVSASSLLWMMHRSVTAQLLPGQGQATYPDLLWHMGLVHEARRSFPLGTPQVVGAGTLHYHWFSDAHMAAASMIAGVKVPLEVLRLFPALFYLLVFGASVTAARELTRARWATPIAALLAAATTSFAPFPWLYTSFTSYAPLSPSQLYAGPITVFAVLAVVHLVGLARRGDAPRGEVCRAWCGVALAAVALSGAKASAPLSILGGLGLLWLWSLRVREARRTTTALLGGGVALVAAALALVAGGDSGTQKQLFAALGASPVYRRLVSRTPGEGAVLPHLFDDPWLATGLLCGLGLTLCLLVSTVLLTVSKEKRGNPTFWMLSGTIIAATLVFLVMRHLGLSEFYFVMGVLQLGVIGAAVGLADAADALPDHRRRMLAGLSGGSLLAAVAWLEYAHLAAPGGGDPTAWLRGSVVAFVLFAVFAAVVVRVGRLRLAAVITACAVGASAAATVFMPWVAAQPHPERSALARDEQAAGLWIDAHVPQRALMATNKHCSARQYLVCSSRQWWISGLGGRRVLVEGWSYTPKSANDDPFFDAPLLQANQRAFTVGDAPAVDALKKRGVSYLVAVKGATPIAAELSRTALKVYGNENVNIYRVR